jgi:hypothetical protein
MRMARIPKTRLSEQGEAGKIIAGMIPSNGCPVKRAVLQPGEMP